MEAWCYPPQYSKKPGVRCHTAEAEAASDAPDLSGQDTCSAGLLDPPVPSIPTGTRTLVQYVLSSMESFQLIGATNVTVLGSAN
jgi:hypothetical protein